MIRLERMVDYNYLSEEYIKCYQDTSRIYMITHFLKTYDATKSREVLFELFPRQKEMCHMLGNAVNMVFTKPRQAGITTTCAGFISCEMCLADPDSPQTVLVIGNTLDIAQQMLTKIRDFLLQLPLWMWGNTFIENEEDPLRLPERKDIFDVCNSKELKLKNGCKVVARSSGPDASRGVGGVTWLIFDEAAFIENGKDVYASAIPTVSTGGHVIMISTPNGKDQLYYETFRQAKEGLNNFKYIELKWYQDPRYNKNLEWVKKDEETGDYEIIKEEVIDGNGNIAYDDEHWSEMIRKGYSPRSPWYVNMCQSFNNNPQKIAQELDVSFLGSDSNVVDAKYIKMQEALNVREPDPSLKDAVLEETWVWKPPYEGHRYIMGIDNSRGDADDATALEIIDLDGIDDDGKPCIEQVLEYSGKLYGDSIGEIAYNYGVLYNMAFIIVEDIGGYGSATLLTLMGLKYPNLYYDDPSLKKFTENIDASSMKVTQDGLPGFHSSSVRFQMLTNFANLIKTNQFKIRSSRVIKELDTWIFKNGRIDHKDGCHDDTLTCLAMALFVMTFSLNRQIEARAKDTAMLKAMISINSRIVVNKNNDTNKPDAPLPMLFSSQKLDNAKSNLYKANMWLFK